MKRSFARGALLMLLMAASATATTLRRLTLEQVVEGSSEIMVATVTRTTAVADDGPRELIFTNVELGSLDVWSGEIADATVSYRFAGGTVGGRTLHVPGVPKLVPGTRYVLFLDAEADWLCPTVGWIQGCYELRRDAKTGVTYVRDSGGRLVYGFAAGLPVLKPSTKRPRALTEVEFQVEVTRSLEAIARRAAELEKKRGAKDTDGASDSEDAPPSKTDASKSQPPPANRQDDDR